MRGFRSLYYDVALSASHAQLSALLAVADPTHVLFGSDVLASPLVSARAAAAELDAFAADAEGTGFAVAAWTALTRRPSLAAMIDARNAQALFNDTLGVRT